MCSLIARLLLFAIAFPCISQGAVTEWRFVKEIGGTLVADDQEPTVSTFEVEVYLATSAVGDAASVTISGGGIVGSLPLTKDGSEWWLEQAFQSEVAMDLVFPNDATYTISVSGGTLGGLTQTFSVGARAYPKLPHLTGDGFSSLAFLDPTQPFDFVFADPGNVPDVTVVELEDQGESVFDAFVSATQLSVGMTAGTLEKGKLYAGSLIHGIETVQSGTNGFGVSGRVYQTASSRVQVDTNSGTSIIGAWSFGDSAQQGSGVVVLMKDGTYFHVEDTEANSGDPDGFEKGTYTWNEQTGAFSATPVFDGNGTVGLSHPSGSVTVTIAGNVLTYTDGEGSTALPRVDHMNGSLVGAWQFGEGSSYESRALVFMPNGVYWDAQKMDPQISPDGIEKGTYSWNEATGRLSVSIGIDTNGSVGFSDPIDGFTARVSDDELVINDNGLEWRVYLVDPNTPGRSQSAVTEWSVVKRRDHVQNKDDVAPEAVNWSMIVTVKTEQNQDAADVAISGGGIAGNYPLAHIGREWTWKKEYDSEAELDAEFPAGGTFTITLSGGFLGTRSQTFSLMADAYPNTPYLKGSAFSAAQSVDSFQDFGMAWSDPGLYTNMSGKAILEVSEGYHYKPQYELAQIGAETQGSVPRLSLDPGHTFYGSLEFTHSRALDGSDGFGVDGVELRSSASDFILTTLNSPLAGAWSYGDASSDDSGVIVFLNSGWYFQIEDVSSASSDPDGFERGKYEWDPASGAFSAMAVQDTNGAAGFSDSGAGMTASIAGSVLSITDIGTKQFARVASSGTGIAGGWQYGDAGPDNSSVYVFLENGYYFNAENANESSGIGMDGIERGTYSYDEDTSVLSAIQIVDTNGELGLSDVDGEWSAFESNKRLGFGDNRWGYTLYDAEYSRLEDRIGVFDVGLMQALRGATGKLSGDLMRVDLQRLFRLDASGLEISELSGIGEANHLRELDLSHNALTDIFQVGDLAELRALDLSYNQISSISDLSRLTKLKRLNISANALSDPGVAAVSSELIQLFSEPMPSAATGALAPLEGIASLEVLKFASNGIRDLAVLASLPGLKEVDLSGNQISDLAPLQQLPELVKLTVFDNPVDLTEGSDQRLLLDAIASSTGAKIVLEALDPFGTYLSLEWDEGVKQYRLVWTEAGVLLRSTDLKSWSSLDGAQSPYRVDFSSETPLFWKLEL